MVAVAVDCFASQTWPNKELVILDDAEDPSFDQAPLPGVIYERHKSRKIWEKRNIVCDMARGHVIVNWDSDDWNSPERIASQIATMLKFKRDVAGYNRLLFWDAPRGQAWQYEHPPTYGPGSTLMFTKAWWKGHKFPNLNTGEDFAFGSMASSKNAFVGEPAGNRLIAMTHPGNSSKRHYGIYWRKVATKEIPEEFFKAIARPRTPGPEMAMAASTIPAVKDFTRC